VVTGGGGSSQAHAKRRQKLDEKKKKYKTRCGKIKKNRERENEPERVKAETSAKGIRNQYGSPMSKRPHNVSLGVQPRNRTTNHSDNAFSQGEEIKQFVGEKKQPQEKERNHKNSTRYWLR